jgi:hypothetical protein
MLGLLKTRMYVEPIGKSRTKVMAMMLPWAVSSFSIVLWLGPAVVLELLPMLALELEEEGEADEAGEEPDVFEGADVPEEADVPEGVDVPEGAAAEDVAADTNGLVSEDKDAAERSKVNWLVLSKSCWGSVYERSEEPAALPWYQAQIQGDEEEVALESKVHVVPVCRQHLPICSRRCNAHRTLAVMTPLLIPLPSSSSIPLYRLLSNSGSTSPWPSRALSVTLSPFAYMTKMWEPAIWVPMPRPTHSYDVGALREK